jgi:hypothetical protein
VNVHQLGCAATSFSAPDRLVLPLSFTLGQLQRHAHDGGARIRRIAARMALTMAPVTATSASWKVMARSGHAWHICRSHPVRILMSMGIKLAIVPSTEWLHLERRKKSPVER